MSSYWQGRSALVTGAGGFIGSHVVGRLVEEGASVRAFVRYTSGRDIGALRWEPAAENVEIHFGDLRDPDSVRSATSGCEAVLHLGAAVSIPYSLLAPREVIETNVIGTLNVLAAAREQGAARVLCLSTSEVYGTPEEVPVLESHPLAAQSPYAASKVGADQLARAFQLSYEMPVGIARPFNSYGPRQSDRAVIPTILSQAIAGGRVKLGALHPVRDLTFVTDTVAGLVAFAAWDGMVGKTLQLGSGEAVSVSELVRAAEDVLGKKLEVDLDEQRLRPPRSEVERLICDPSAAERELGWRAEVGLRDGLRLTAEWIERHPDQYHPGSYSV